MNEFKKIRRKLGVSARVFAKLIGSNICSVYNYESGLSKPRKPEVIERMNALSLLWDKLKEDRDFLCKLLK